LARRGAAGHDGAALAVPRGERSAMRFRFRNALIGVSLLAAAMLFLAAIGGG
jgi:hypothetical protein